MTETPSTIEIAFLYPEQEEPDFNLIAKMLAGGLIASLRSEDNISKGAILTVVGSNADEVRKNLSAAGCIVVDG